MEPGSPTGCRQTLYQLGFPCGSDGKEFTCNAGDPSSIPELGRSPGQGIGYPLQYFGLESIYDSFCGFFFKGGGVGCGIVSNFGGSFLGLIMFFIYLGGISVVLVI